MTYKLGSFFDMKIKVYEYKNCNTCRQALQYLDRNEIEYDRISIIENPPSLSELQQMAQYLKTEGETFKKLFNTSGQSYRELGISEKIKNGMSESTALALLSKNGKLIKRPFLLTDKGGAVGFKPDDWRKLI